MSIHTNIQCTEYQNKIRHKEQLQTRTYKFEKKIKSLEFSEEIILG